MKTLNEGEALNKIKKGLKGAAIGAGVLGATAAGITGYGAVNGVKQARAEKAALERQAEEERAAKDKFANDLSQNLHKRGVEVSDYATTSARGAKEIAAFAKAYENGTFEGDVDDKVNELCDKYGVDNYIKVLNGLEVANKAKTRLKTAAITFKTNAKLAAKEGATKVKEGAVKVKEFLQKKANSAMQEAKNKKVLHDEKKIAAEMKNYVASLAEEMNGASHTIYNAYRDDSSSWDLIPFCQKEYLKGLILREGEENVKKAIGLLKTQDFGERKITSQYVWSHQYKKAVEELKDSGFLKEEVNYFPY